MYKTLNRSLCELNMWCRDNFLTVNASKTIAMIFNKKCNDRTGYKLMFNDTELELVNRYNYLGVIMDNDLSFLPHFNKIISSCNQKLFTLSKIRKYITQPIAIRLYKTLILPIIDYGDVFYNCLANTHLDKVQKVQNRALHIVDLPPRHKTNVHLHKKYQVIPLFIRRGNNLVKLIHTFLWPNLEDTGVEWDSGGHGT